MPSVKSQGLFLSAHCCSCPSVTCLPLISSVSNKIEQRPSASSATLVPSQLFLPKLAASKELWLPSVISGFVLGSRWGRNFLKSCGKFTSDNERRPQNITCMKIQNTSLAPTLKSWDLIGILGLRIQDHFLLSKSFSAAQSYWLENATRYTQVSLNREVFFTSQFRINCNKR